MLSPIGLNALATVSILEYESINKLTYTALIWQVALLAEVLDRIYPIFNDL
jgi:hypothetical protein